MRARESGRIYLVVLAVFSLLAASCASRGSDEGATATAGTQSQAGASPVEIQAPEAAPASPEAAPGVAATTPSQAPAAQSAAPTPSAAAGAKSSASVGAASKTQSPSATAGGT